MCNCIVIACVVGTGNKLFTVENVDTGDNLTLVSMTPTMKQLQVAIISTCLHLKANSKEENII
jgi:hypothetical protein